MTSARALISNTLKMASARLGRLQAHLDPPAPAQEQPLAAHPVSSRMASKFEAVPQVCAAADPNPSWAARQCHRRGLANDSLP